MQHKTLLKALLIRIERFLESEYLRFPMTSIPSVTSRSTKTRIYLPLLRYNYQLAKYTSVWSSLSRTSLTASTIDLFPCQMGLHCTRYNIRNRFYHLCSSSQFHCVHCRAGARSIRPVAPPTNEII